MALVDELPVLACLGDGVDLAVLFNQEECVRDAIHATVCMFSIPCCV